MKAKSVRVVFGRSYLPFDLGHALNDLLPRLRGRTIALILIAHALKIDLNKLIEARDQMRRLGVLLNQSLRLSLGREVDQKALAAAVKLINSLCR